MTDLRALTPSEIGEGLRSGKLKVVVVGLGYVGLPLAALLAKKGAHVIGVDKRRDIVENLAKGRLPIHEPGLSVLFKEVHSRNLYLSTDLSEASADGDLIIVCVGTPVDPRGKPLLKDLTQASASIGQALAPGKAVMIRSTVPPGTTKAKIKPQLEGASGLRAGIDFALTYCPERLVEGKALEEIEKVPHIIGAEDELSFRIAQAFFVFLGGETVGAVQFAIAEMAKICDNVYRNLNIALANELALICEALGMDVFKTINVANQGPRTRILMPGCGVGGSCLTKDPMMLAYLATKKGLHARLIIEGGRTNRSMPTHTVGLVRSAFQELGKRIAGSRISVMGLAYKGETDDVRESVARQIIFALRKMGARVVAYDPYVSDEKIRESFGSLEVKRDPLEAAVGADCLIVTADHMPLRGMIPEELIKRANRPAALVDGRNVFNPTEAMVAGFVFRGVGRATRLEVAN